MKRSKIGENKNENEQNFLIFIMAKQKAIQAGILFWSPI